MTQIPGGAGLPQGQTPNQVPNQMPNQTPNQIPNQMSNQMPNQVPWVAPAVSAKKSQTAPPVQMETVNGTVVRPAIDEKLQGVIAQIERSSRAGYGFASVPGIPVGAPQNMYTAGGAGAAGAAAQPFRSNMDAAKDYQAQTPGAQAFRSNRDAANEYLKLNPEAADPHLNRHQARNQEFKTLAFAIFSLLLSVFPFIGLVVGAITIFRTLRFLKEPKHSGLTIAALVLGALTVLINIMLLVYLS